MCTLCLSFENRGRISAACIYLSVVFAPKLVFLPLVRALFVFRSSNLRFTFLDTFQSERVMLHGMFQGNRQVGVSSVSSGGLRLFVGSCAWGLTGHAMC